LVRRQVPLPSPCYDLTAIMNCEITSCTLNIIVLVAASLLSEARNQLLTIYDQVPTLVSPPIHFRRLTGCVCESDLKFTASWWYAITSDSCFMLSSFRKQSELRLFLRIRSSSHCGSPL